MRNEELLGRIARRLADLRWKHVFVGGATTHLYLTDPTAPTITATEEVDVIVDVRNRVDYRMHLTKALRDAGAREDTTEDAVASEFAGFLRCADFEYAVSGYLRGDTSRTALVLERTRAIAGSALK